MRATPAHTLLHALLAFALLIATGAWADGGPLPPFEAHYRVTAEGLRVGEARFQLAVDGDRFVYSSQSQAVGIAAWFRKEKVRQESEWILHGQQVRPLVFRYDRRGGKKDRSAVLAFDWEALRVTNQVEGQPWEMDIPAGTLDKLVVALAVMLDLQLGKREMIYDIADGGRLKRFRYRALGEERIETPAGTFDTLKLERVRLDKNTKTIVWTAPSLRYLPVRIEQEEDKNLTVRSELDSFTGTLQLVAPGTGEQASSLAP